MSEETVQESPKAKKGRERVLKGLQPGGMRGHPTGPGTSPPDTPCDPQG